MTDDLIERLRREAAAWDDWNEDHPDDAAVTTPPLLREAAAALEAAREERDELAKDAAKYRWGINNARWIRSEQEAYVAIPVAPDANLSCVAMRDAAIDRARGKGAAE